MGSHAERPHLHAAFKVQSSMLSAVALHLPATAVIKVPEDRWKEITNDAKLCLPPCLRRSVVKKPRKSMTGGGGGGGTGGRGSSVTAARAVTYADLGGVEDVLADIKELIEYPLKHPEVRSAALSSFAFCSRVA